MNKARPKSSDALTSLRERSDYRGDERSDAAVCAADLGAGLRRLARVAWGLRAASYEIAGWRERARNIPDPTLREDALGALSRKRTLIVGAALFVTLPRRRNLRLLRLLVAYEATLEYLDNAHERAAYHDNGRQLHRALTEALDPSAEMSDYYRFHPWRRDGGYLRALVQACRDECLTLPSYESVRPLVLSAADRCAGAQSSSHVAGRLCNGAALQRWAEGELAGQSETSGGSAAPPPAVR